MSQKKLNLTAYLFGNLAILCLVLIGLWRGQPVWDTTVRLPSLLIILVVINSVLIFREGMLKPTRDSRPQRGSALYKMRQILAMRNEVDEALVGDALNICLEATGQGGMSLLQFEEGGHFTTFATCGNIPNQFSSSRMQVNAGDLCIKHPASLGEESLGKWDTLAWKNLFRSRITCLNMTLVPLFLVGKRRFVWALFPPATGSKKARNVGECALFLESILSLDLFRTQSAEGKFLDMQTGLLRFENFRESFETEVERSERYSQNMTLLSIAIAPFEGLPEVTKETLQRVVAISLRESLRRLDLMFCGRTPGRFAAILTETNTEIAGLVAGRILSAFKKQVQNKEALKGSNFRVFIGTATYPEDATHGAGLLEKTEEALSAALKDDKTLVAYSSLTGEDGASKKDESDKGENP